MAVAAAAQQPDHAPSSWGLSQLMHALGQVKAASGTFTERKTLHMLKAPLVSSGTLSYVAPDRVVKVTLAPRPEKITLDADQVTMKVGRVGDTHTFSVTEYPQIGDLIEGVRATLAGNLTALDRYYTVRLTGSAADWQLLLLPREVDLAKVVRRIRIRGSKNRIREIETDERNGDRSVMAIAENVRATH